MAEKRPDRTVGRHHDVFWQGCAEGQLRVQRCNGCGKMFWPASASCDGCGSSDYTWMPMSGHGRIAAWGTFVQDYYRGVMPVPYQTIMVELDEGPLFISNPVDIAEDELAMGLPVTVRFIDAEDSAGAFRLPVFGPAG